MSAYRCEVCFDAGGLLVFPCKPDMPSTYVPVFEHVCTRHPTHRLSIPTISFEGTIDAFIRKHVGQGKVAPHVAKNVVDWWIYANLMTSVNTCDTAPESVVSVTAAAKPASDSLRQSTPYSAPESENSPTRVAAPLNAPSASKDVTPKPGKSKNYHVPSAYNFFVKERNKQSKAEHGFGLDFTLLGQEWRNLTAEERQKYENMRGAETERRKRSAELEEGSKGGGGGKRRRASAATPHISRDELDSILDEQRMLFMTEMQSWMGKKMQEETDAMNPLTIAKADTMIQALQRKEAVLQEKFLRLNQAIASYNSLELDCKRLEKDKAILVDLHASLQERSRDMERKIIEREKTLEEKEKAIAASDTVLLATQKRLSALQMELKSLKDRAVKSELDNPELRPHMQHRHTPPNGTMDGTDVYDIL